MSATTCRRHSPISLAVAVLIAAAGLQAHAAAPPLPVPCVPGTCGTAGPKVWVSSGAATAVTQGNTLQINQTSEQAILNWSSFNVAKGSQVIFKQPDGSSIALNRIFQANPSQIFGLVKANGQIYLINQNGFIFGSTSVVNVGGLLASSLDITDATFHAGLLSAIQNYAPALTADLGPDGKPIPAQIQVQKGAQLSTNGPGQRLMLASGDVDNAGSISAPDGQVIVAAGQKVYLQASTDPQLRGLLVEVDGGGVATNEVSGQIESDRGNVTVVGLAVNQLGRVTATTSTSANGSVRLQARDNVAIVAANGVITPVAREQGQLQLGSQSLTQVIADPTDQSTAVDAQVQPLSQIGMFGQQIEFDSGSKVLMPGGQLTVQASASTLSQTPDNSAARIRVDGGATIDLAGNVATVPVTRNLVSVQLRANELADSPLQQNGALRGQTVVIDARVGTPLANVAGQIALIPRTVQERTDQGGTASFSSAGDIVVGTGASINVSGGAVNYTGGMMQTTQLVRADGSTVDIGQANPNQVYIGLLNPTTTTSSDRWGSIIVVPNPGLAHYEAGYVQGASAGSIQFAAPNMVLNGTFTGTAVNGPLQRSGSGIALGGSFIVGNPGAAAGSSAPVFNAPEVELVSQAPAVVIPADVPLPPGPLRLPIGTLEAGGFTQIELASDTHISIPANLPIVLAPGSSLSLTAPRIDIDSGVTIPGGTVTLNSVTTAASQAAGADPQRPYGVFVGDGTSFDLAGSWTNDQIPAFAGITPTGLTALNGGSVVLDQQVVGGELSLGSGVSFNVNGGAWLHSSGSLLPGSGGAVSLNSGPLGTFTVGTGLALQGFGVQGASGGSFQLSVPRLALEAPGPAWLAAQSVVADANTPGVLSVGTSLFTDFGFSDFVLTANGPRDLGASSTDTLTVNPGTAIQPTVSSLVLSAGLSGIGSLPSLSGIATAQLLPVYARPMSSVTLAAVPTGIGDPNLIGTLSMGHGAQFSADPGSSFSLLSIGSIADDGSIRIASGNVTLGIEAPPQAYDPGYVPDLGITIGKDAVIDVAGTALYTPSSQNLLSGQVLPGGSIALIALRGSVSTAAGSSLNLAGASAPLDLPAAGGAPVRTTVGSAGGSLDVQAAESFSLLGSLAAQAGAGSATGAPAPGGTLTVALTRLNAAFSSLDPDVAATFPTTPRIVSLVSDPALASVPPASGSAALSVNALGSSGIQWLNVLADDAIELGSGVNLSLARGLVLQSPAVIVDAGANAHLAAPYVALGSGVTPFTAQLPEAGTGTVSIAAQSVDFIGSTAFQGARQVTVAATGEIQLRGNELDATNSGNLLLDGNLALTAARVVPGTATTFSIQAGDGTVTFAQGAAFSGVPLSVAGSLSVTAANINQGGTIIAPYGMISLNATGSLNLLPGSVTSVSGDGAIIPYGEVLNGTSWLYQVNSGTSVPVTSVPAREVALTGGTVTLAKGATINVSGGGDLFGYQWTPGTGGTKDALANTVTPGLYAIMPSLPGQAIPYDPMAWAQSGLTAGESVYLSGGAGVAPGTYLLLPARYALLSGAYLVQSVSGYQDLPPTMSQSLATGGDVQAGYLTSGTTGIGGTRYSGFAVYPGSYASTLAQYDPNYASTFLAPAPGTASISGASTADAGTLSIQVQQALSALGTVNAAGAAKGLNGTIELSAPQIDVDPSAAGGLAPGTISISTGTLASWNPGRLLLGGQWSTPDSIQVSSNSIVVAPQSTLSFGEVVLVANQSIAVGGGAIVESASLAGSATPALGAPTTLALSGSAGANPALLAVSDSNAWLAPNATTTATGAQLTLAAGSTVGSRGSIALAAPGGAQLADGTLSGKGAQWSLSSGEITFGAPSPGSGGLAIDASLLKSLNSAKVVSLLSSADITLAEPVVLAGSLQEIDLTAASLVNQVPGGLAQFNAALVRLGGVGTNVLTPTAGSGTVQFAAHEIDITGGALALSGFGQTTLAATTMLQGEGTGGLVASGNLAVVTPVVTAASGASTYLTATGDLSLSRGSGNAPSVAAAPGGALALGGANITDSTSILMPSGYVALNAAGALTLVSGATINTAGVSPAGALTGSDGGTIVLSSGNTVNLQAGALLSVAAGHNADAGSIAVSAGGTATLANSFSGTAASAHQGGSVSVRAATLANFTALTQQLATGGFTAAQDFRATSGSLDLAAGSSITASSVSLSADHGAVSVEGTINASGAAQGGSITLAAGGNTTVSGTLLANAIEGGGPGGSILVASTAGEVSIDPGATIAATGAAGSGSLYIRAPALTGTADISVGGLPTDLSHVGMVYIQPLLSYALPGSPGAGDFATILGSVSSYMASAAPNITTRLGVAGTANLEVQPYLDMTTNGDLALSSVDFSAWRFAGVAPALAFRATGNLTVNGTLGDGFTNAPGYLDLSGGSSSSMLLVAGADLNAALPNAVVSGAAADLILQPGAIVRTGSGSLELVAARDLLIQSGASIYTGGVAGAPTQVISAPDVMSFASGGGPVRLSAGRDIVGTLPGQSVGDWQPVLSPGTTASWGVDFAQFGWSVGALGGGDVAVAAGRNIVTLSAAAADSAVANADGTLSYFGGGNLSLSAGGDIDTSVTYVANGTGRIVAGGALGSVLTGPGGKPVGTLLMAGNASYDVAARGSVLMGEVAAQGLQPGVNSDDVYFYRFGPNSQLSVQSFGGSVTLDSVAARYTPLIGGYVTSQSDPATFSVYPANVGIASFAADVTFVGDLSALPSTNGELSVYAARNISASNSVVGMSDSALNLVPTATSTSQNSGPESFQSAGSYSAAVLHLGDTVPVQIYAGQDIDAIQLALPKAATVTAGRDINDLSYFGQNTAATDITSITAGGNISYSAAAATASMSISGPGGFELIAAGNIDFGLSAGVTSYGSLLNPSLPALPGASLTLLAGLGAPLGVASAQTAKPDDFISTVIAPSTAYQQQLVAYVEQLTGMAGLSFSAAAQDFRGFSTAAQLPLLSQVFFAELDASGKEANESPSLGFSRGYAAIDELFPGSRSTSNPYTGNFTMAFSGLHTLDGGAISILVPGGSVNVGLANPPPDLGVSRLPSELGIVTVEQGDVSIFSEGNVLVNQSRVFTLGGGNIVVWSTLGNIDAGRGAKTSISAPPPTLVTNSAGDVTLNFSGAVAGSGIRTIITSPDVEPGNVDLIAPVGFVNAGDAGIGASGNLNIAAQQVLGAANIQVGGTATGVPPPVSGVGLSLSGASAAGSSATSASTSAASDSGAQSTSPLAQNALSWIDVFVLGLGDENCAPSDLECLKREKEKKKD